MSDYQTNEPGETQSAPGAGRKNPMGEFLKHQQRAAEETFKAVDALFPPGFKEHGEQAGREFVSGIKVLADAVIDGLQQASKDFDKNLKRERPTKSDDSDHPSSTGATKVKVQVD
jgi:hypothetical protein